MPCAPFVVLSFHVFRQLLLQLLYINKVSGFTENIGASDSKLHAIEHYRAEPKLNPGLSLGSFTPL